MTPWSIAHQVPLSVGFSRQEYWSGLPFPSPGDLPDPGIKPGSPTLQVDSLLLSHWGSHMQLYGPSPSVSPNAGSDFFQGHHTNKQFDFSFLGLVSPCHTLQ